MDLHSVILVGFAVGTTLVLLLLLQLLEPGLAADFAGGNVAKRLLRAGQVLGVFLVAAAAVKNCVEGDAVAKDALWVAGFGVVGLVLLVATGRLGVRLLFAARLAPEVERGNIAAGLAGGADYVATGIITSTAMAGHDLPALGLSIAFFVLAQVTLHVFVSLFRALTTYDDAEQIAGENLAAAISYAGVNIAIAIVVARAIEGDFAGWMASLKAYGIGVLAAFALYPVRQIFVQSLLLRAPLRLRGGRLDVGISVDRDVGLAALEAVTYLATALSIARLV